MGHLSANPAGPDPSGDRPVQRQPASKGHRWLWIIALAALVAVGFWYFHGSRASTEAQGPPTAGGGGSGQGRQGMGAGGFVVPVVVATAQRGDLPVYFNGLGTVTAFNTVTVRSRVDGQITKINFQEGHFANKGKAPAETNAAQFKVSSSKPKGNSRRTKRSFAMCR